MLLLDEPTASLDLGYQLEIAALLRRLNADARHDDGGVHARSEPGRGAVRRGRAAAATARVLAHGADRRTRSPPTTSGRLYGVDADVHFHAAAGHLTVVPIARTS